MGPSCSMQGNKERSELDAWRTPVGTEIDAHDRSAAYDCLGGHTAVPRQIPVAIMHHQMGPELLYPWVGIPTADPCVVLVVLRVGGVG